LTSRIAVQVTWIAAAAAAVLLSACGRVEGATHWEQIAHSQKEAPPRAAEPQVFPVPPAPFSEGVFPCSQCHEGGEAKPDDRPAIPHLAHLEKGLGCADCHIADEDDPNPKVPADREMCDVCHGDPDKLSEKAKAYFAAVTTADGGVAFPRRWKTRDVRQEHVKHGKAGVECTSCHGEPSNGPFAKPKPVTLMDRCISCHEEKGKPVTCETCHTDTTHKQHANIVLHHAEQQRGCLDCHDQDDRDRLKLANGTKIEFQESYRLCGQCHGTQYRDWREGLHGKRTGSWNGRREYRLCVHCHYPHAPKFPQMTPVAKPARPEEIR